MAFASSMGSHSSLFSEFFGSVFREFVDFVILVVAEIVTVLVVVVIEVFPVQGAEKKKKFNKLFNEISCL